MEAGTTLEHRLTARELDALPHEWDTRYELMGGVLFMSRRPSFEHQEVMARLLIQLGPAALKQGGRAVTEPGIVWDDDGEDNVVPDVAVLLTVPVPPPGQKLRSCPDLVVEILSRDEGRRRDLEIKRRLYWRKGAREYWVVDSEQRTLLQLTRGPTEWVEQTLTDSDIVRSSLLPRWEGVALSSLFSPT